jgi:hypothetical protein
VPGKIWTTSVLDHDRTLVMRSVLATRAAAVIDFLDGIKGTLHVTFEECCRSAWLYDLLAARVAKLVRMVAGRSECIARRRRSGGSLKRHIAVFYLPSYSPELNPDELLNADLKQRVTKAAPAINKLSLTRTAIGALRSIQKQTGRVENYFVQKDVCYAAA